MEVEFTSEQGARLGQIAAVLEAQLCADRGELIESEEMDARFERILRS
jgi:hypothetical protein